MGVVKALSPEVYRKIAAGEVVERPLSVVKELVENSLDAGAGALRIELDEGGKKKIRIIDDGCGFYPEDITLAFSRHSTSKLTRLEDFDHLKSLGFRGEALPSIAQVARISLTSSTGQSGLGVRVNLDAEGEKEREECVCSRGTDMIVSDLFYNFPVRKRFLKSERTELNAILRYLEQLALAYWTVAFSLRHNGRELFSFPAVSSLRDRIYQVFGKDFLEGLMPLENDRGQDRRLKGWISKPGKGGRDRQRQFFFVNGRNVREKTLIAAFNQAYAGLLEKERHPQGVLLVDMPSSEIDVNIHPMKLEIKFVDNHALFSWVYRVLGAMLKGESPSQAAAFQPWSASSAVTAGPVGVDSADQKPFLQTGWIAEPAIVPGLALFDSREREYRILGQFIHSYIVVEKGGELLLVDQHNAHETVIYNRLSAQLQRIGKIPAAATLFPILCELSPQEWARYEDRGDELGRLGYELEPLGNRVLSIRAYPAELSDTQAREILRALLNGDDEESGGAVPKKLATISCKSAIKVNHPLTEQEMRRLLDDFFALDQHEYCPHGRPIVVTLSVEEIEKRLKRR